MRTKTLNKVSNKNKGYTPIPITEDVEIELDDEEAILFNMKTNKQINVNAKSFYSIYRNKLKIKKEFFAEEKRVKDVWRYNIIKNGSGYKLQELYEPECPFCFSKFIDRNPPVENKNICLLIIESPHKDEYCRGSLHIPVAPAQGNAGERIHNQLEIKINIFNSANNEIFTEPEYQLVICNPVQFQASLHVILGTNYTSNLKNKVWRRIFTLELNENGCDSFINRLKGYEPKIIINSCTYGLRERIKKQIEIVNPEIGANYLYTPKHPSFWNTSTMLILQELKTNKKGRSKNEQK